MGDSAFPDLSSLLPAASTSTLPTTDFPLDPSLGLGAPTPVPLTLDPALWSDDQDSDPAGSSDGADSGDGDDYSTESDETDAEEELAKAQATENKKRQRASDKGKGRATEMDPEGPAFDDGIELGRLISAIRDSNTDGAGGRTALEQEFDRAIEDELEQIDTRGLFAGTVKGKPKRAQRAGGRRKAIDIEPSAEVRLMLGNANRYYASGELDEAIQVLTDVVRIDPNIRAPWFTLATIWEEKGDKEKNIMFKIVGTHLGGTRVTAQDWAQLGGESRDIGLLQQSIYCFTQAIKRDKDDVDSMWDRAVLLKLSGSNKQAIKAFTAILQIHPHDPGVLREVTPLLAIANGHAKAMTLLLDAYNYNRDLAPNPTEDDLASFGPADLESLADFLTQQRKNKECVRVVKEGVRWMQGRAKEKGWDKLNDDREFDEERKVRDEWEKQARFLEEAPVYELDVRLRVRLGVARMALQHVEEAQRHFALVLRESVAEFPELYGAVADAYHSREMWTDAIEVYQDMAEDEDANGPMIWNKIADCNEKLGDFHAAKECYAAVVDEEPDNLNAKFALARCYEQLAEPAEALKIIREVLDARRRQRLTGARVPRIPDLFRTAHTLTEATRPSSKPKPGPRAGYAWDPDVDPIPPSRAKQPKQPRPPRQLRAEPKEFDPEVVEELRRQALAYKQDKARKVAEWQITVQAETLKRQQERAMYDIALHPRESRPKPARLVKPLSGLRAQAAARLQDYIDRVAAMSMTGLSVAEQAAIEDDLDMAEDLVAENEDDDEDGDDAEGEEEAGAESAREKAGLKSFQFGPKTQAVPRVPRMNRAVRSSLMAVDREAREQERKHEFTLALQQLAILEAAVKAGDEGARNDWLSVATYLVDSFRETRQLFPSDGKRKFVGMVRSWKRKGGGEDTMEGAADLMEDRLLRRMDERDPVTGAPGSDLPEAHEFRGLDFDGWLKLIIRYAFLLVQNDEAEAGQETLTHILHASPFKMYPHRSNAIRLARISCYLHVNDLPSAVTLGRTIMLQHQFQADALRLLQALMPAGQASVEMWNMSTLQKFTIRQLKLIDHVAAGKPHKVGRNGLIVLSSANDKDEDGGEELEGALRGRAEGIWKPTRPSACYQMAYAAMLLTSRSFQSAIIYLLRALEQAPEQPLIHLCLGVSYLHRAMSRQTDNREHQIAQAFGFLSQYRDLLGPGQEVEYNFGRAFHHIGLNAYAVKHYEQCLNYAAADRLAATSLSDDMAVDGMDGKGDEDGECEYDDYAKAAAYNLSSLYMFLGQGELAKQVVDRWLAV